MPIPAAMASPGPEKLTGAPSISIVPDVGSYSPYSTFMSVDLPAPFSPSKQWIWWGSTVRFTRLLAVKSPNFLVTSVSFNCTVLLLPGPPAQAVGAFLDCTVTLPSMMSCLSCWTCLSRSWLTLSCWSW